MTPAINLAKKAKIKHCIHEYSHHPGCDAYGLEAVQKLGISETRVFKTLIVSCGDGKLAVGVVPVSSMLNMKRMAKALGTKKVSMAQKAEVERSTGYILGGVSPLGQKKRLPTVIDASSLEHSTIYVSAGRRGLEIELSPQDLKLLTKGNFAEICA